MPRKFTTTTRTNFLWGVRGSLCLAGDFQKDEQRPRGLPTARYRSARARQPGRCPDVHWYSCRSREPDKRPGGRKHMHRSRPPYMTSPERLRRFRAVPEAGGNLWLQTTHLV